MRWRYYRSQPSMMKLEENHDVKLELLPLEFITLTERPASQKANFSYTVRSRAMQSFVQTKHNPRVETQQSRNRGAVGKENQLPGQLSGKFKLSTWSRKPRRKVGKPSKQTEVLALGSKDDAGLISSASQVCHDLAGSFRANRLN